MITYKRKDAVNEIVFLELKRVGMIRRVMNGWQYFPKNSKNGSEIFKTILECKYSLEGE